MTKLITKSDLLKKLKEYKKDGKKILSIAVTITDFETENGYDVNVTIYYMDRFNISDLEAFAIAEEQTEEDAEEMGEDYTDYMVNKGYNAIYKGDEMA